MLRCLAQGNICNQYDTKEGTLRTNIQNGNIGDTVLLTCDLYYKQPDVVAKCFKNGSWYPENGKYCIEYTPEFVYYNIQLVDINENANAYLIGIQINCTHGYELSDIYNTLYPEEKLIPIENSNCDIYGSCGHDTLTYCRVQKNNKPKLNSCNNEKKWKPISWVKCKKIQDFCNTYELNDGTSNIYFQSLSIGDKVILTCSNGYTVPTTPASCSENQTWLPKTGKYCQKIQNFCSIYLKHEGTKSIKILNNGYIGSEVQITCETKYVPLEINPTCMGNKEWEPQEAKHCIKKNMIRICNNTIIPYKKTENIECYTDISPDKILLSIKNKLWNLTYKSTKQKNSTYIISFMTPIFENKQIKSVKDGEEKEEVKSELVDFNFIYKVKTSILYEYKIKFEYLSKIITEEKCTREGVWYNKDVSKCLPCNTKAAICPGGGKILPKKGYWSLSQYDQPIECSNYNACVGTVNIDGVLITNSCNEKLGYTGEVCSKCLKNYYKFNNECRKCKSKQAETARLIITLIFACVYYISMVVGVVFLSDRNLSIYTSIIIYSQQVITILSNGASLVGPNFASFISALDIINMKIEFTNPGCAIGIISFNLLFWISILFAIVFALLIVLASYFYFLRRPSNPFSWRCISSLLILLNIIYIQFCTRAMSAIDCKKLQFSSYYTLAADNTVICYKNGHIPVLIFSYLLLMFYIIGFPAFILYKTYNLYKSDKLYEKENNAKYGFFYRKSRKSFFWFHIFIFIINLFVSLKSTIFKSIIFQLASTCFVLLVNFLMIGLFVPYKKLFHNLFSLFGALVTIIQTIVLMIINNKNSLFIVDSSDYSKIMFYVLIGLFCLSIILIGKKWLLVYLKKRKIKYQEDVFTDITGV